MVKINQADYKNIQYFPSNNLIMNRFTCTLKTFIVMLAGSFMPGMQSLAQQATNSLYAQTSEMADGMIQYSADKASIMRFYSTT